MAAVFLIRVENGESLRPFFGSWYNLRGWKQTGYCLGHEVIRSLEVSMAIKEIARLEEFEAVVEHEVETLAWTGA